MSDFRSIGDETAGHDQPTAIDYRWKGDDLCYGEARTVIVHSNEEEFPN
jgi:hypothetical protein